MNSSLRDQLLAAGLVTEKQARQASQQEQQRQYRDQAGRSNKAKAGHVPHTKPNPVVHQAQVAKASRDQELNRRHREKAERKARIAQIEQLVEENRLPRLDSDDHFSFIDGKKIRRMSVDAQRREQLTRGEMMIVRYRGHYAVVPAATAERIRERDANMVVPLNQASAAPAETDDTYKDFVVPDDLMW
jgi:uncharacterized protein YaiL (DUF2058 family)